MTDTTQTTFDVQTLRDALASWDVDALMTLYTDDVELRQIDHATPPSAPQVIRGRDAVEAMFRDVAARGIQTRVVDVIDAGDRLAIAVACRYPTGECVYEHSFLDLRDGRIARQAAVTAWDS